MQRPQREVRLVPETDIEQTQSKFLLDTIEI
jgi:hypothetical protein